MINAIPDTEYIIMTPVNKNERSRWIIRNHLRVIKENLFADFIL